jgi:hypothetical protein
MVRGAGKSWLIISLQTVMNSCDSPTKFHFSQGGRLNDRLPLPGWQPYVNSRGGLRNSPEFPGSTDAAGQGNGRASLKSLREECSLGLVFG